MLDTYHEATAATCTSVGNKEYWESWKEAKKENEIKENKKAFIKWLVYGIVATLGIAFLIIISLRQYIFPSDGIVYNLYNPDYATNIGVKILKSIVIIVACLLASQAGNWITVGGMKVKNSKLKRITIKNSY